MTTYQYIEDLEEQIIEWGYDKTILPNPDKMAQWTKTEEEVMELRDAILSNDRQEARDAIGDIVVTLIMQCQAWGFSLGECIDSAYQEIRYRNGRMVDGVFVKNAS